MLFHRGGTCEARRGTWTRAVLPLVPRFTGRWRSADRLGEDHVGGYGSCAQGWGLVAAGQQANRPCLLDTDGPSCARALWPRARHLTISCTPQSEWSAGAPTFGRDPG